MNTRTKRNHRARHNQFLVPSISNLFTEIMNAPIQEIIKEDGKRFTIPGANVIETDQQFELSLAVPGLTKKDIKIDLENDKLIISAEKEDATEVKFKLREFNYGTFKRKFSLPKSIDQEKISATVKDGILKVILSKKEEQKPKTISIK